MHVLAHKLGTLSVLLADALGDLSSTASALLLTLHHRPDLTGTELATAWSGGAGCGARRPPAAPPRCG
jgi:hypothetical protein